MGSRRAVWQDRLPDNGWRHEWFFFLEACAAVVCGRMQRQRQQKQVVGAPSQQVALIAACMEGVPEIGGTDFLG